MHDLFFDTRFEVLAPECTVPASWSEHDPGPPILDLPGILRRIHETVLRTGQAFCSPSCAPDAVHSTQLHYKAISSVGIGYQLAGREGLNADPAGETPNAGRPCVNEPDGWKLGKGQHLDNLSWSSY